jgi:hypothetical protein
MLCNAISTMHVQATHKRCKCWFSQACTAAYAAQIKKTACVETTTGVLKRTTIKGYYLTLDKIAQEISDTCAAAALPTPTSPVIIYDSAREHIAAAAAAAAAAALELVAAKPQQRAQNNATHVSLQDRYMEHNKRIDLQHFE